MEGAVRAGSVFVVRPLIRTADSVAITNLTLTGGGGVHATGNNLLFRNVSLEWASIFSERVKLENVEIIDLSFLVGAAQWSNVTVGGFNVDDVPEKVDGLATVGVGPRPEGLLFTWVSAGEQNRVSPPPPLVPICGAFDFSDPEDCLRIPLPPGFPFFPPIFPPTSGAIDIFSPFTGIIVEGSLIFVPGTPDLFDGDFYSPRPISVVSPSLALFILGPGSGFVCSGALDRFVADACNADR